MALDFPNTPTTGQIFNQWQWDGVKWVPFTQPPAATSGNRVLLGSQTVSAAVAAVSFLGASLFPSTYDEFVLEVINLTASVAAIVGARVSTDGATLDAGVNYQFGAGVVNANSVTSQTGSAGLSYFALTTDSLYFAAGYAYCGTLRLWRPWATGFLKQMLSEGVFAPSTGSYASRNYGVCRYLPASVAVVGLGVMLSTGNITAGTFNLYGIQK
jgi:membrane protein YqaA with SNARE-associated domain